MESIVVVGIAPHQKYDTLANLLEFFPLFMTPVRILMRLFPVCVYLCYLVDYLQRLVVPVNVLLGLL